MMLRHERDGLLCCLICCANRSGALTVLLVLLEPCSTFLKGHGWALVGELLVEGSQGSFGGGEGSLLGVLGLSEMLELLLQRLLSCLKLVPGRHDVSVLLEKGCIVVCGGNP